MFVLSYGAGDLVHVAVVLALQKADNNTRQINVNNEQKSSTFLV
jgi:hypothetical protein